jgi:hypothetical protein
MELVKFPLCHPSDTLVFPAELTPEDSFGLLVTERPNHDPRILLRRVKRNAGGWSLTFPCDRTAAEEYCEQARFGGASLVSMMKSAHQEFLQ